MNDNILHDIKIIKCDQCGEICKDTTELYDHILIIHDKLFVESYSNYDIDNNSDEEDNNVDQIEDNNVDQIEDNNVDQIEDNNVDQIEEDNNVDQIEDNNVDQIEEDNNVDQLEDNNVDQIEEDNNVDQLEEGITEEEIKKPIISKSNETLELLIEKVLTKQINELMASRNKSIEETKISNDNIKLNDNPIFSILYKSSYKPKIPIRPPPPPPPSSYLESSLFDTTRHNKYLSMSYPLYPKKENSNKIPEISLYDTIISHPNGKFECPICKKKYITQAHLGEHFTITHNDYTEQLVLDNKNITGYPGFELLEFIGMILPLDKKELHHIISENKECDICDIKYSLIDNNESSENSYPILLTCCKSYICKMCIEKHTSFTNSIKCPYCLVDHTKNNLDYITIIEFDNCNKESWLEWKIRNSHIYDC